MWKVKCSSCNLKDGSNNNNKNGLITVSPPSASSPVKTLQYKAWHVQYTAKLKYEIYSMKSNSIGYCKNVIEISNSKTTLSAIYKLFTNVT